MIRYRAAWILPIAAAPIRSGFVTIADGRIVDAKSIIGLLLALDRTAT